MRNHNDVPTQPNHIQHRHWHYIYRKRRTLRGISTSQMAYGQVISLAGSIVAGILLEANKEYLALIAGAFVILPGVFDLDGTIGAALSAKINHRLEVDARRPVKVFLSSVWFALRLAFVAGCFVGLFGAAIATIFFDADFWKVFVMGIGAICASAVVGFPLIGGLSLYLYRRGVNPDDVVGPIESSLFDILTVVTLSMFARILR